VFYESPHRILDTLAVLADLYPEGSLVIARELTKRFETITNGLAKDLLLWTQEDEDQQRGEFVLILSGVQKQADVDVLSQEHMLKRLIEYLPPKKAVQLVVECLGGDKKLLYARAVEMRNEML
jgi:16S rRNA (cytidine1402-2'-O)-methyltransferase